MLPPGLGDALLDSWDYFLHLAATLVPLFLVAAFLVGLAREYLPPAAVEEFLRGHGEGTGNVVAAGLGAVTPFCSCSTVPVLAGLVGAGAPLGLAFSFLLASPLVNEVAVLLLVGLFGVEVTAYYVAVTFAAAVVGGIVVGRLGLDEHVKEVRIGADSSRSVATDGGSAAGCGCGSGAATDGPATDCRGPGTTTRTHWARVAAAAREARSFLVETLPYLVVGITVGALIHGAVPVPVVRAVLGPGNPLAVPLAALAGAPIYVSLSGMLPVAASLGDHGVPIGTVLAFVVGGAGVSLPNLVLLNRLFDRRLLAVYAGTVVATGIVVGVAFNAALA